jgi:hypothetical protein
MFDLIILLLSLLRGLIRIVFTIAIIKTVQGTTLWGLVSKIKIRLTETFYHFGLLLAAFLMGIFFIIAWNLAAKAWPE